MSAWQTPEVEQLFEAVLSLESMEECRLFFEDVCTIKELLDISQRLKMAKMLYDGAHYSEVSKVTNASTTTISRVSKCLEYGNGGYKTVLSKLKNKGGENNEKK